MSAYEVLGEMSKEEYEEYQREYNEYLDEDTEHDPFMSDAEADADVLASAGWGTDEDYVWNNDYFDDCF